MKNAIRSAHKIFKNANYKFLWHRHHSRHKHSALDLLKSVEQYKGKTNPELIKLSNEYAQDVLGWRGYAPWLYVYSAVAEQFIEGWIPGNYYGSVVMPTLKGKYGEVSDLKSLANRFFPVEPFPDLVYYVNGLFISTDNNIISSGDVRDLLFKNNNRVVYKKDNSQRGRGVYFFNKDEFDANNIYQLGNGVFQEYIDQHRVFEEILPSSVATIRATTVLNNDGVASLRACLMRIARKSETHVRSASNIRVPINIKTGEFDSIGYLPNLHTVDRHPDTNAEFGGRVVPIYNELVSTLVRFQKLVPQVRCIGWDLTVDKANSIKIMEWNGTFNGIFFSELKQGPCFADLGWEKLWRKN